MLFDNKPKPKTSNRKSTAIGSFLGTLVGAAGLFGIQHAVSPAQARQPPSVEHQLAEHQAVSAAPATYGQVQAVADEIAAMRVELRETTARVRNIELEQAKMQGARDAAFRERR